MLSDILPAVIGLSIIVGPLALIIWNDLRGRKGEQHTQLNHELADKLRSTSDGQRIVGRGGGLGDSP